MVPKKPKKIVEYRKSTRKDRQVHCLAGARATARTARRCWPSTGSGVGAPAPWPQRSSVGSASDHLPADGPSARGHRLTRRRRRPPATPLTAGGGARVRRRGADCCFTAPRDGRGLAQASTAAATRPGDVAPDLPGLGGSEGPGAYAMPESPRPWRPRCSRRWTARSMSSVVGGARRSRSRWPPAGPSWSGVWS